jgi:hypothetical protein
MKTIGVTVADGDGFEAVAEPMLKHWSGLHGDLPFKVLGRADFEPYRDKFTGKESRWLKPHLLDLLPDYDRIVYLDADTFTVQPWLHLLQDGIDFAAVVDVPEVARQKKHPKRKQFRADWYFNSGVFVLGRSDGTKSMCSLWWELRKRNWPLFVDQDALNRALHDMAARLKVQVLPHECNVIIRREIPDSARVVHWAGMKNELRFREMKLMSLLATG